MKQIKAGEYKLALCRFCQAKAGWRSNKAPLGIYACDKHREEIVKSEQEHEDDGYMTEADHQTWGRL